MNLKADSGKIPKDDNAMGVAQRARDTETPRQSKWYLYGDMFEKDIGSKYLEQFRQYYIYHI